MSSPSRPGHFKIINGDPTLHNIRAKVYDGPGQPPGADVFNFGQAAPGPDRREAIRRPRHLHPPMRRPRLDAMLGHGAQGRAAFGVTDADGKFKLRSAVAICRRRLQNRRLASPFRPDTRTDHPRQKWHGELLNFFSSMARNRSKNRDENYRRRSTSNTFISRRNLCAPRENV